MSSCIILAAGESSRMGRPKYDLPFSESETFLEHILHIYRRFKVKEIILVVNDSFDSGTFQQDDKVKIVINDNLDFGRFYSIQLGLQELTGQNVYIQNIDNPFVNLGLLMNMKYELTDTEFVVPVYEEKAGHPVLISSSIVDSLKNDFNNDDRFNEVLRSFKRKEVIVSDPYISVNINTPEDYNKYFSGLME